MDLSTIIGFVVIAGSAAVSVAMLGGNQGVLFSPSGLVLVLGSAIGAAVAGQSLRRVLRLPVVLRKALFRKPESPVGIVRTLIGFAYTARRAGVLALEPDVRRLQGRFLRTGLQLVIDGAPSAAVRETMEAEMASLEERHRTVEDVLTTMGRIAPAAGAIWTIILLSKSLEAVTDPAKLGSAVAASVAPVLYGLILANLVILPLCSRLRANTRDELSACDIMLEGILSIQSGDNPRIVESKLLAFLAPEKRASAAASQVWTAIEKQSDQVASVRRISRTQHTEVMR